MCLKEKHSRDKLFTIKVKNCVFSYFGDDVHVPRMKVRNRLMFCFERSRGSSSQQVVRANFLLLILLIIAYRLMICLPAAVSPNVNREKLLFVVTKDLKMEMLSFGCFQDGKCATNVGSCHCTYFGCQAVIKRFFFSARQSD